MMLPANKIYLCTLLFLLYSIAQINTESPCASRQIRGQSVVCVCNTTYCDDIVRQTPLADQYVSYTSSRGGARFLKNVGSVSTNGESCRTTITLDLNTTYQTVQGFGGAVTDASSMNWMSLEDNSLKSKLIDSYFSENGLQYNMLRVPIGGSDFSTHAYAYNELPEDDARLSNYSLSVEDYQYKIPMIKAIFEASADPVHIVATTWSPPTWMKTNERITGISRVKPEYFQTYADYHIKFLEKYASEGINVWGITTTNEPFNGVVPWARFNSLGWTPKYLGQWIAQNLGPTIRNSTFADVKIIAIDDQRIFLPLYFNRLVDEYPEALQYIDGLGVHYYTDGFVPASVLSDIANEHPDKFILATEACEGSFPWQLTKVVLGSWSRAQNYINDILDDLNNQVVGWIDWNLCLDQNGGPNWARNFVDSPIIVFPENKEFVKQPMFYAMGHFSKFIPRESIRIKTTESKPFLSSSVKHTAFLTKYNTVVVVLYNDGSAKTVCLSLGQKSATVELEGRSIVTVELNAS